MSKCFIITILLFVVSIQSFSQSDSYEGLYFDGYSLGATLRQLNLNKFLIADIPFIEARVPFGSDFIKLKYGGHLMWGLKSFFVEWTYATGIYIYPLGHIFSVNATVHLGTFFFDNITYIGSFGANLNFFLTDKKMISFGVDYFYRNSRDLLDFISFPVYGNEEVINIDSPGIAFSIGFLL